jgi:hypothetical protein
MTDPYTVERKIRIAPASAVYERIGPTAAP